MRSLLVLLVLLVLGFSASEGRVPAAHAMEAGASLLDQQPDSQPQQPVTSPAEDDGGMTSAGWANVLWIVVILVLAVAFVWLAMAGLRSRTRE
jgi:hypothetical protein